MSKKLPIVAIVGRANVGKSSLFNAVLKRREAIVAREAGTTRDSIFARAEYKGHQFWLVDTAGVKDPEDEFEFTIQEQIEQAETSADIIWVVIEADAEISQEDRRLSKTALKTRKPVFLLVNKADKKPKADATDYQALGIKTIILTSATQNSGIDELLGNLVEQIPKTRQQEPENLIKLAILGRPNVGKSYLFNTLAKKQQAIVSDRAGTTRDVNRVRVRYEGQDIELLDTAGIRRSGKIERGIEKFSVIRTLAAADESDVCLLLVDVNELHVKLDQKIAGIIKEAGKGLILVVTKWDTLDKDAYVHDQLAARLRVEFDFVPWAPVVFTSSVTGQNVARIFDMALDVHKNRQKFIKTAELNRWLAEVVSTHPPAGLKNTTPKLNYIVQESDHPTNFKVYGRDTRLLHWSYKRFMERKLRETFGFDGTPVKFWFFDKDAKPSK